MSFAGTHTALVTPFKNGAFDREAFESLIESQIAGGKRYDLAIAGRRLANATFHTSHATDRATALTWAMDLTPLVPDDELPVARFTLGYIDRLRADVAARLRRFT